MGRIIQLEVQICMADNLHLHVVLIFVRVKIRHSENLGAIYLVYEMEKVHTLLCQLHGCNPKQYSVEVHNHSTHH